MNKVHYGFMISNNPSEIVEANFVQKEIRIPFELLYAKLAR